MRSKGVPDSLEDWGTSIGMRRQGGATPPPLMSLNDRLQVEAQMVMSPPYVDSLAPELQDLNAFFGCKMAARAGHSLSLTVPWSETAIMALMM